ncbi:hypothetical protein [Haloferax sulfurifontis]|nr:hypothetical protein [Haloferax sulfurifontis]
MRRDQVLSLVLTALVLSGTVVGSVALFTENARADIDLDGFHECADDIAVGGGFLIPYTIYDNVVNEACWDKDTSLSSDELQDLTDNGTYETVVTLVDTRSNEDRLIDSLLNTEEFSKRPVWHESELQAADVYLNNGTESDFVNAGTTTIDDAYDQRKASLAGKYNRDVRNAENTYNKLVEVNQSSLVHFYVNGSEVDTSGGITFSVPTGANDTANGTAYSIGETSVQIATVTVNGTTYDFRDNVAITMEDPAGEFQEVPILGRTIYNEAEQVTNWGTFNESTATRIVDDDGTTGFANLSAGLNGTGTGDVVYVKGGDYTVSGSVTVPAGVTLITDEQAVINDDGGAVFQMYDNSVLKGFVVIGNGTDSGYVGANMMGNGVVVTNNEFRNLHAPLTAMGDTGITFDDNYVHNVQYGMQFNDYASFTTIDGNYFVDYTELHYDNNNPGADTSSYVTSASGTNHYSKFYSFTKRMVSEQEADRQELLNEWGDINSGYAHEVWNQLQVDAISITDIVTFEQMFTQSFDAEDTGSIAFFDAQYLQAGMTGHELRSTAVVEVQTGSSVLANAQTSNEVVLPQDKTYSGHIWTMNPPAGGEWQTNTTYNTTELGGPVYVVYYQQVEKMTSDGIVVETEPATIAVKGEFRFNDIIDGNGTSVDRIGHGGTPRVDPYNASTYTETVERVNERNVEIVKTFESDNGGGGAGSSCTDGYPIIGCVDGVFASFAGLLVVLVFAYAFASRGIGSVIDALLGGR